MSSELTLLPHTPWTRVRTVLNWLNLSTLLGLAIARLGGASIVRRGRGTYLATGYRFGFPVASAFTVGSVITSKHDLDYFIDRPVLLQHEDRHCTQYAFVLGVVMLPFYFLCVGDLLRDRRRPLVVQPLRAPRQPRRRQLPAPAHPLLPPALTVSHEASCLRHSPSAVTLGA